MLISVFLFVKLIQIKSDFKQHMYARQSGVKVKLVCLKIHSSKVIIMKKNNCTAAVIVLLDEMEV